MAVLVLAGLWLSVMLGLFWHSPSDDLSATYMGASLLAEGLGDHLYAHHPIQFHIVDDPVWHQIAAERGFDGFLHPYVQTPLWAWLLRPSVTALAFPAFSRFFLVLHLLSVLAVIVLAGRLWNRGLLRPGPIAATLVLLTLGEPLQYALFLGQTHMLFLAVALGGLLCTERGRPLLGGTLVAVAAAIKPTFGALVVWWIFSRQWRAVLGFCLASVGAILATLAAVGPPLFLEYLRNLERISDSVLVAFNSQSFLAALHRMGGNAEVFSWEMHPVSSWLGALNNTAGVAALAGLGWVTRRGQRRGAAMGGVACAGLVLLGTLFAPLSWSHYYLVLLLPWFVILGSPIGSTRTAWLGLLTTVLLSAQPIAVGSIQPGSGLVVSSHLLGGLLTLALLLVAGRSIGAAPD